MRESPLKWEMCGKCIESIVKDTRGGQIEGRQACHWNRIAPEGTFNIEQIDLFIFDQGRNVATLLFLSTIMHHTHPRGVKECITIVQGARIDHVVHM